VTVAVVADREEELRRAVHAINAVPSPCDGCRNWDRCAARMLACESFLSYVRGAEGWDGLPRKPTRALFGAVSRA
jgi:hypothetical protein